MDWCDILHGLLHLNAMHVGLLLRAAWKGKRIITTNHDVTLIWPNGTKIRYDGPCTNRAGPIVCMQCLKRSRTPNPLADAGKAAAERAAGWIDSRERSDLALGHAAFQDLSEEVDPFGNGPRALFPGSGLATL